MLSRLSLCIWNLPQSEWLKLRPLPKYVYINSNVRYNKNFAQRVSAWREQVVRSHHHSKINCLKPGIHVNTNFSRYYTHKKILLLPSCYKKFLCYRRLMTTVTLMEHAVIVCREVRRNAGVKKKLIRRPFSWLLALQPLIKGLLSFAGTCHRLTQIRPCQQQRGGPRLSKEPMNAAKGNVKHISEGLF